MRKPCHMPRKRAALPCLASLLCVDCVGWQGVGSHALPSERTCRFAAGQASWGGQQKLKSLEQSLALCPSPLSLCPHPLQLNLAQGGFTVPSYVDGNITLANQIIGDRVFEPVGNGLCPCCASNSCGAGSVCRPASQGGQGCRPLDGEADGTNAIARVLATW